MKKSLLALAVLGTFGGIAAAQTSVTLYGIVDANISRFEAGDKAAPGIAGTTVTRMNDGTTNGINGSRWGLRGSEDLGGGTRAIFTLESGFNIDTGNSAQGGRLFGRQAFVGVAGGFGQLTLGRHNTPVWNTMAIADPFGQGQVGNVAGGFETGRAPLPLFIAPATNSASLGGVRNDNSVNYRTPNFDGFVGEFQYRLGETVGNVSRGRQFNMGATFTSGPLSLGAGYQQEKTVGTGATRNKVTMVVGSFDLGVARLHAGLQSNRDLEVPTALASDGLLNKHTVYTVGATVPLAPFTILANYTTAKFEDPQLVNNLVTPTSEGTVGKFALGAQYNLSRRSILYTGFSMATGDFKDSVTEKTAVNVGVRHAF
jgi:predicted porin